MDPKALGTTDWQQITVAVNQFWLFAASLVVAALSFGLAHAVIRSWRATRQLPSWLGPASPIFYFVSAVAALFAVFFLYRAVTMTYFLIRGIYPRWWI